MQDRLRFCMANAGLDAMILNRTFRMAAGFIYGTGGAGFLRFNLACPRCILTKALDQLAEALK